MSPRSVSKWLLATIVVVCGVLALSTTSVVADPGEQASVPVYILPQVLIPPGDLQTAASIANAGNQGGLIQPAAQVTQTTTPLPVGNAGTAFNQGSYVK